MAVNPAPSASETSGPAIAILNSAPGRGEHPAEARHATEQPQGDAVDLHAVSRRAWNAWPSSCRSSETKKSRAAATAMPT